jgi:penicillin-binding protein 1A
MPVLRPASNEPGGRPSGSVAHGVAFWTGIVAAVVSGVLLLIAIAFVVAVNALAPDVSQPDLYALNRPASLTFVDENDQPAGQRGAIVGDRVTLSQLPPYVPKAFIAEEDRDFYQHHGIDPEGMLRAAIVNFQAGHVVQGGSTITQQLVKMLFLTPDRTMARKLREIGGALALERRLTKQQILELYLNRLYLGSGAYGIDAAAHVYFGKSARDLTVAQAAMLAALTRAPSAFSPRRDLEAAQDRAGDVLAQMVEIGAITPQQQRFAERHPAVIAASRDRLARNYFLDAAADEVRQLLPTAQGDLIVSTTLDSKLESAAASQLSGVLNRRGRALHASQGALVSMTTNGAVRALVGGVDYSESAFNRVTNAHRQPGSAFKAFVYLAAFEHGLTPATVRVDQPVSIQDLSKVWTPDNYSQTYLGPVTLEEAFAKSINTIAVQLGQEIGIADVVDAAHRLGIQSPLNPVPSLAIGTSDVTPLEMTAAYGAFATLGRKVEPYLVREIRSSDGSVLYRRPAPASQQVFSQDTGLEMNDLLYQVVQDGTGHAAAVPGHEVAGKTGTSSQYRDAWFIGFSPDVITGVWVGNDDSSPMNKVTGGLLPAQIWSGFMRVALQNRPDTPLPRAQPVPMLMAQTPPTGDNGQPGTQSPQPGPFDGLGRFFGGLFGSNPPPPPPPQQSAQAPPDFFTERRPNSAAPTPNNTGNMLSDGGNTNANTSNGSSASGSISGNTGAEPQAQGRRNLATVPPPDQYSVPSDSSPRQVYGYAPPDGNSRPPRVVNRATPPAYPVAPPPGVPPTPGMPAPYSPNDSAGPFGQSQIPPNFPPPPANSPAVQPQEYGDVPYGNSRSARLFNRAMPPAYPSRPPASISPQPDLPPPGPLDGSAGPFDQNQIPPPGNATPYGPLPDQAPDSSGTQQGGAYPDSNPG